ncbi:Hypothetical protein A7982_09616 [Minicystis rosea]|nr:Hypothetical protein A7982_09616 [Minicystis rosea]
MIMEPTPGTHREEDRGARRPRFNGGLDSARAESFASKAARSPRQLVHRGVVEAAGILVDEVLASPVEARRRVVAAWARGASVHRLGDAFLVRFPQPRRVDCALAPGLVLVRTSSDASAPLASAPLASDELRALAPPPGSVVLVRGGVAAAHVPAPADTVDPASFLDLDAFPVVEAVPLGAPPEAPKIVGAQTNVTARALLGIADPPAEQSTVAASIAALAAGRAPIDALGGTRASEGGPSFLTSLAAGFGALLRRLFAPRSDAATERAPRAASIHRAARRAGRTASPLLMPFAAFFGALFGRFFSGSAGAASNDGRALAVEHAAPAGPSLGARLAARMRTLIAKVLVGARLAHLIGRRQAEYVGRLLDMLDRGDLDAALRHAIPLGGGEEPSSPMLGAPSPRSDLSISLGSSGPGTAMFAAKELHEHLCDRYRRMFERLEREGRIDEAAFVLAELLRESAEAVAFLERHGRLRLAAELAEARALPPGLVVRQWFLAGDVERAVRIARRHGAFGDALVRMQGHQRAPGLRVVWAETLAEAGDFAAAVDVVWPVESARRVGTAWIERAIAQGGVPGARMLAKKLALTPSSFPEVRDQALALVADDGPGSAALRRAFAAENMASNDTPAARALSRAFARALVHDAARFGDATMREQVMRVVAHAADAALGADLPAWPAPTIASLASANPPRAHLVGLADVGSVPILDAAYLPRGRLALALGEAGVRVVGRDGRALFHLDQPAHRLVISDHGDRAIAVAPRGEGMFRLARLDLVQRRSEPWCEASFDVHAPDFDGSQWVVARGKQLFVIDVLESRFEALARFAPGGEVMSIGRSPTSCSLITHGVDGLMFRVRYELPAWLMRVRKPQDLLGLEGHTHALTAASGNSIACMVQSLRESAEPPLLVLARDGAASRNAAIPWPRGATTFALDTRPPWIAGAVHHAEGIEVRLFDDQVLDTRCLLTLAGATYVSLRLSEDALTVVDDRGRALVVDLAHGHLIHDLRA